LTDFEPIAPIATQPHLIVAKKVMPADDLKGLIAWLKANPDKASAGTNGVGSPQHVAAIYFQSKTGTRFGFVPYRGGAPAFQDLLAGQIDLIFAAAADAVGQVRGGTVKTYAVMAKSRIAAAPNVPTVDEAGLPGVPGKVNVGSAGTGSPSHIAGELFKMMTGVAMTHVPYRGRGPAVADLLGAQVQVVFSGVATSIELIRAGKLRPLAVTTTTLLDSLPAVPALTEFVKGYEVIQWYGLLAPRNTSAAIVEKLNREINTALADPMLKARLAEQGGGTVFTGSAADFGKLIAEDTEKWGKVVRFAGLRPE
jgi:tripartite-type tricarboxylate transporter receptor subunit TctC